jgi:hypothetical protein
MITVLNTSNLGVSEYDTANVIDIVEVSGTSYFLTASGIYYLDEDSFVESVTSTVETGYVMLGDSSPKRIPHLELLTDTAATGLRVYSSIDSNDIPGIDSTRHENVRGYKLAGGIKGAHFRFKFVDIGPENFNILDLKLLPIDTLVKK